MLDRMAFIVGSKALRGSVVTAAVNGLDFAAPAPQGQLVECVAQVARTGQRSTTVQTHLYSENLLSGERHLCLSGEFVMVRQVTHEPELALMPAAYGPMEPDITTVAEIVFPGHANHRGVLHGGPAMAWMAKAGFVAATRRVRRSVVMAGSGPLNFEAPAVVGDVVEVRAQVLRMGKRSVRVLADMWAESPVTGSRKRCASAELVFVALQA